MSASSDPRQGNDRPVTTDRSGCPEVRSDVAGWCVLFTFMVIFAWLCRQRLHMIYPGLFCLALLAASGLLVVVMWRIYATDVPKRPPVSDNYR